MITEALLLFGIPPHSFEIKNFGSGLINHTWLITTKDKRYILQKINTHVFTSPQSIDKNMNAVADYIKQHSPEYLFTAPLHNVYNKSLIQPGEQIYCRLFEFVEGSHSYTVLQNPALAYEAAKQFGRFTKILSGFDISKLHITLPDFHNLSFRYQKFLEASVAGNKERIAFAASVINDLKKYKYLVDTYQNILNNPAFKKRVTHHDTKISNVLFDADNKGICVIDLDTVMPGYFISDVGDMMRTYLSAAGEEETDFSKIDVREKYFDAIVKGYLDEMNDELSAEEKNHFVYAGQFLIYMQALRFITDYLNNDIYYGASYELHNYNRTVNQLTLLNILTEKENSLNERVNEIIHSHQLS